MLPCDQYDSVRVSDVKGIFFCRFNPSKSTEAGGISCKVAFVDEEAVSDSEMTYDIKLIQVCKYIIA